MSTGCMCIQCREQTALEAVIAKERQADFEHWAARLPGRILPRLRPDHESRAMQDMRITLREPVYSRSVGSCALPQCAGLVRHASGHR